MSNKRFVVVPVLFLLLFGLVATAAADPPDREGGGPLPPYVIADQCEFDVLLEDLTNKESFTTFYDQDGNVSRFLITGALKVRLTNMDTGESIDLNIPGPGRLVPQPDGSTLLTATGPWLMYELGISELPAVALVKGRVELLFDSVGNPTLQSLQGNVQDVCGMLAGS